MPVRSTMSLIRNASLPFSAITSIAQLKILSKPFSAAPLGRLDPRDSLTVRG